MTVIAADIVPAQQEATASVRDYIALLKPRVMSLVVFTGLVGLYIAPGQIHPLLATIAILCLTLGSGAAGAFNMWYEWQIDAQMHRTQKRPIPMGRVTPEDAFDFALVLAAGSVLVMGVALNYLAAGLLLLAILFYVFVYTMWLKPMTSQNIVIGGAAGAFPALIGWSAVTGTVDMLPLLLFLIVFMWTPPHFWALALYRGEDYKRVGIPMLPVVAGVRVTTWQMLMYTIALVPLTVAPAYLGLTGMIYGVGAGLFSLYFLYCAVRVHRVPTEGNARKMFGFSILYLFALFLLLVIDHAIYQ